ncbi:2-C-methyl-D-erythritol 4-phosphate cytidylyltransferase [Tamaricihabitans halophyticus]|uniref:IspD/TarI family cytidylyltransferase n=1 Tax=Tamaricihabitans halophyticus TaxID=1262583 RepID=UPI001FB21194
MPNALTAVRGEPLLRHALRALGNSGCVTRVFVAAPNRTLDRVRRAIAPTESSLPATIIDVDAAGTESSHAWFDAAQLQLPELSIVLLHDVLRAFTPPDLIRSVVDTVQSGSDVVVPVQPVADTIKRVDAAGLVVDTYDRSGLRSVQSPRGYSVRAFREQLDRGGLDHSTVSGPYATRTIPGHPYALKITTSFDLTAAEAVFASEEHRGSGRAPHEGRGR